MSKSGNQRKEPINGKGEPPRRLVNEGAQARQIIGSLFFSLTAHTRRAKSVASFAMCLKNKKKGKIAYLNRRWLWQGDVQ